MLDLCVCLLEKTHDGRGTYSLNIFYVDFAFFLAVYIYIYFSAGLF